VLAYDAANPHQPLAATYPSGKSDALGDPELDYPYVLLATSSPAQLAAANVFGEMLQIRWNGLRGEYRATPSLSHPL